VGGLLAEPALAYPEIFPRGSWQHTMFSHETGQPYALPPIFVFVFGFVVAIPMVCLWLPETSPVTVCDVLHGRCSRVQAAQYKQLSGADKEEEEEEEEEEGAMEEGATEEEQALGPRPPQMQEQEPEEEGLAVAIPTYFQMLTARDSGTALGTLALLCPTWITYQELFPLFCKAAPLNGGLGFSAKQIGWAMTISGIVLVIYQPLVFPKVQRRFGNVKCYRAASLSMNILLLVFPFFHFLHDQGPWLWVAIVAQRIWETATATAMWMPSFIMIMNTAMPEYQGRMQGLAGAVQMSLMALSPTFGGTVWNATVGKPWPISPHTAYACLNVIALAMLILACYLPASLDMPKSETLKLARKPTATAHANGKSKDHEGPHAVEEEKALLAP
jgi:hypothetical protein